jgi:nucleotide-binding universal stress UspA family protein
MSSSPYRTIMVGVDPSELSAVALEAAVPLANRFHSDRLHLVRVVEPFPSGWPAAPFDYGGAGFTAIWKQTLEGAKDQLEHVHVPSTGASILRKIRVGTPARELAREAVESSIDLIVLASHDRRGIKRAVMGSVASTLLRIAHCPVLVVSKDRPGQDKFRLVLAAVDLSPITGKVLTHAFRMAAHDRGLVEVISLIEKMAVTDRHRLEEQSKRQLERWIERVKDPGVVSKAEVIARAPVPNAILDLSMMIESDLLVVGTSGHNVLHRMILGSTATRVVAQAPCPVLVVPHDAPEAVDDYSRESSARAMGRSSIP